MQTKQGMHNNHIIYIHQYYKNIKKTLPPYDSHMVSLHAARIGNLAKPQGKSPFYDWFCKTIRPKLILTLHKNNLCFQNYDKKDENARAELDNNKNGAEVVQDSSLYLSLYFVILIFF